MAKKEKRSGKHTNLVLPSSPEPAKEPAKKAKKKPKKMPDKQTKPTGAGAPKPKEAAKGDNTILMPSKEEMLAKHRNKKRWKRIRWGLLLIFIVWLVVFFVSGTYLTAWVALSEGAANVQIAVTPGNGFPMDFAIVGYQDAKPMGDTGFAVLGEKDLGIVTSTGRELLRVQHGYVNPQMTTSKNRVCIYNRGGKEYRVTTRTGEFFTGTADNSIMFAQLSPGGWLALCTTSRSRFEVSLYSTSLTGGPVFKWSSVNDIPVMAAFHTDDRTMALGCITSQEGAMGAVVYLFKTDKWDKNKMLLGTVQVSNAIPVQMHFLGQGRIMVLYNQGYAAIYNTAGEELARYDYGGRVLQSAHYGGRATALVFSASGQDSANLVVLDEQLRPYGETVIEDALDLQVLCGQNEIFVLDGQEVLVYEMNGTLAGSMLLEGKPNGLVNGGVPLAITAGGIFAIGSAQQGQSPASSALPPSAGGSGSASSQEDTSVGSV